MEMDVTQTSQMLKWLDEERRKDRAALSALQERVEQQAQQLARQEEQLTVLRSNLATVGVLANQVGGLVEGLERIKAEVAGTLDEHDEQFRKEQREVERTYRLEMSAIRDELTRTVEQLRALTRLEERQAAAALENQRLSEGLQRAEVALTEQSRRSEDQAQSIIYLEEQRRADSQRLLALEKEGTEIRQRIDAAVAKIANLEDQIARQRARFEEGLKSIKGVEKVVEELRVADFRRNQDVKKWAGQAEEVRQELQQMREERSQLLMAHHNAEEAIKRLEAFRSRIEVHQNEVAEAQRLAEDRLRRQWEEWQAQQEKDRRNWEVGAEEHWREQQRTNEQLRRRLDAAAVALRLYQTQLDALWEARRAEADRVFKAAKDEFEALIAEVNEQLAELRELSLEEI
jgi:chromosome segregation ATPase